MVKLQLELGASGSQLCLKQGSPVDQIQPRPLTYAWTLAAFTLLQLSRGVAGKPRKCLWTSGLERKAPTKFSTL